MAEISHPEQDSGLTQAKNDEKTIYEIGFHVIPTVAEADAVLVHERVRNFIESTGGSIIAEELPKRMALSYRIERSRAGKSEKYTESYFGWVKFEADRGSGSVMEKSAQADHDILRFIVIRTVREQIQVAPRAVFVSDRLEGETIGKPVAAPEKKEEVSEEDLDKSIESLVS